MDVSVVVQRQTTAVNGAAPQLGSKGACGPSSSLIVWPERKGVSYRMSSSVLIFYAVCAFVSCPTNSPYTARASESVNVVTRRQQNETGREVMVHRGFSVKKHDAHAQATGSRSYSRESYEPSDFVIEAVFLDFDLHETETRVKATLTMYRRAGCPPADLVLDGENLTAEAVAVSYARVDQSEHRNMNVQQASAGDPQDTASRGTAPVAEGQGADHRHNFRQPEASAAFHASPLFSPIPGQEENSASHAIVVDEAEGSLRINKTILPADAEHRFVVRTQVRINPKENSRLLGLYTSDGVLVTHNEAEGFRRITYFLDRPDVLAYWRVRLSADKKKYPVLLSNGDLIESGEDASDATKHFRVFFDPHKKPSYLFALVAGDLRSVEQNFETRTQKLVRVAVWGAPENVKKLDWALQSAIRSMRADEILFGREYDLKSFHIACVEGFNAGAMENKGLNIFNCNALLAHPQTTTDHEYRHILNIIGHEYFHNWSGDRVTVRDWTELTVKEGLTVFRDQEFMRHEFSRDVKRLEDIRRIISEQFAEDSGSLAHAVRPDHYAAVNNLYSVTVYRKGAEIIRMYSILLGASAFREGLDLFFSRFDGRSATCEDLHGSMEEASGRDLSQFFRWFTRQGTPSVEISNLHFDERRKRFSFTVRQKPPPMSNYETRTLGEDAELLHIPIRFSFIDRYSQRPILYNGERSMLLELREEEQTVTLPDVTEEPVIAALESFSAPVRLVFPSQTDADLALLVSASGDPYTRWNALQLLALKALKSRLATEANNEEESGPVVPASLSDSFIAVLHDRSADQALTALLLDLPGYSRLEQEAPLPLDPDAILSARRELLRDIYHRHKAAIDAAYEATTIPKLEDEEQDSALESPKDPSQWRRRALRSVLLQYVTADRDERAMRVAFTHFKNARVMTDKIAALSVLTSLPYAQERQEALEMFYQEAKGNPQLLTKWFALQALSSLPETVDRVRELSRHPEYKPTVPNFVRALFSNFMNGNPAAFHRRDGAGYELAYEFLASMDRVNPRTGARAAGAFLNWKKYDEGRKEKMKDVLQRLAQLPDISKDLKDVVGRALGA
ncbi:aminopeptidase N protein [Besnoitia besnoiti]|uniref:Aminopeptidase N protein n=1 Tax=Besnoitia besnoiti TaxID=94643 RepID=A0A2A9MEP8_BESBE|nr:aminopeptidase N protein [Besnoitia besnoiti]PFH33850.1 aminopeptidase N protein [Besnoitia besnoiti]